MEITNELIKDTLNQLINSNLAYTSTDQIKYIILSKSEYDAFAKQLGENLGYDPTKVKVIRGLPLFGTY